MGRNILFITTDQQRYDSRACNGGTIAKLDLAPTFCEIAGVPIPSWIEGKPLPTAPNS
jgi:arylsulfatase A-like enzyme